ncbi:MAG: four helix bundle protein [Tannerella sp.]|jgi:four helix bundle protein|nr:four helix bundle protein [Tannerella sp.]
MNSKKSILREKSYLFAIKIVRLIKYLQIEKKEFVLQKQLLRSGTSIGALIHEAEFAQSNADFISKFSIALKEANESLYWISILKDTEYITEIQYNEYDKDCNELVSMLVSTIKTLKNKE